MMVDEYSIFSLRDEVKRLREEIAGLDRDVLKICLFVNDVAKTDFERLEAIRKVLWKHCEGCDDNLCEEHGCAKDAIALSDAPKTGDSTRPETEPRSSHFEDGHSN